MCPKPTSCSAVTGHPRGRRLHAVPNEHVDIAAELDEAAATGRVLGCREEVLVPWEHDRRRGAHLKTPWPHNVAKPPGGLF
jgi:hypothetical protein